MNQNKSQIFMLKILRSSLETITNFDKNSNSNNNKIKFIYDPN